MRALADAAAACGSLRRRALALALAAEAALVDLGDPALAAELFGRARAAADPIPSLGLAVARRRVVAVRAVEGSSSATYLAALQDASAAAMAAGDTSAAIELLEEAIQRKRERGLFADAARDLLQVDALAAVEGDFDESAGRLRAAGTLLREAGDLAGAADVLRRAYAANPDSEETARRLEEALRERGGERAPDLVELLVDRAARLPPGPERAEVLVRLAAAHAGAGAVSAEEEALRAALAEVPGHPAAESRLLELLAGTRRSGDRARLLLERSARTADAGARLDLRREAARLLGASSDPGDRELAAETWRAVAASLPADLEAARAAAGLLLGLGRRDDAVPHLEALVRADFEDAAAADELATAYAGRPADRAELFLSRAARAEGERRAALLREAASALFTLGDDDRARATLRDAFVAWPGDGAAFEEAVRDASGDVDRLDAVLSTRARAVPAEAASCHRARGDALRAAGRSEDAVAAYEAALAASPGDPAVSAALAASLAEARGDAAAAPLDRALVQRSEAAPGEIPPGAEAPARYRLGLALSLGGGAAEALVHLERALSLAPHDGHAGLAWAAIAQGHAELGDAASALAAARARVERANALGLEEERRAAREAEAELADRFGLPPDAEETVAFEPPSDESGEEESVSFEPPAAEAAGEEPFTFELPAAEPSAEESVSFEPPETEPANAEEPVSFEPPEAEPAAEESVSFEPPEEEPSAEEPVSFEPLPAEPATEEPVAFEPPREAASGDDEPAQDEALPPFEWAEPGAPAAEPAGEDDPVARAAAWLASADALARSGASIDDVRAALEMACEVDPDAALPWRERARLEEELGDRLTAARYHLAVWLRAEGDEAAGAALHAARILEEHGEHTDAARAYRGALHARPGVVPAAVVDAADALAAGDDAAAARHLASVHPSELPPSLRGPHARKLAAALARAGRMEAAREALVDALASDPADTASATALVALDARTDDWAAAAGGHAAEAAQAVDAAEGAALYVRAAHVLRGRVGDAAGAIAALRAALARARSSDAPAARATADEASALLHELGAPAPPAASAPAVNEAGSTAPEDSPPELAAPAPELEPELASAEPELVAETPPPPEAAPGPGDDVASALEADAAAAFGADRAELLEQLASHRDAAGDRAGAVEALLSALEADPTRDATFSWIVALSGGDEEILARAETARGTWLAPPDATPWELQGSTPPGDAPVEDAMPPVETDEPSERIALADVSEPPSEATSFQLPEEEPAPELPPLSLDGLEREEPAEDALVAAEPPPEPAAEQAEAALAADATAADAEETPSGRITFEDAAGSEDSAVTASEAPPASDPQALAREGRARMEGADWTGAYERLSLALAREPSDLTLARDLSRVCEKLRLFDEYVQLGEICADAISAYDPLAAAARYRHFAEVLRDKVGSPERASAMLEKSLALVPDDPAVRRELVVSWTELPATAQRALDAWLEIARDDPADAEALAAVALLCDRIAGTAGEPQAARLRERGRLAASLAAFAAPSAHPRPASARTAAQVPVELRARVAAPGATGPVARLLELLAPWLESLFPADLGRRGAAPEDRLEPARAPALASALDGAARALGARSHATFLVHRPAVEVAIENTKPAAIVVTRGAAALDDAALSFLAARTLDLLDHGWALVGKFSPRDVGILLELACRFAGGVPRSLGLPAERAGAFLAVLETQVPAAIVLAARELGAAAAQELEEADPRALAAAIRRTANRVALLYAGDPGAALRTLAAFDRRLESGARGAPAGPRAAGPPGPRAVRALGSVRRASRRGAGLDSARGETVPPRRGAPLRRARLLHLPRPGAGRRAGGLRALGGLRAAPPRRARSRPARRPRPRRARPPRREGGPLRLRRLRPDRSGHRRPEGPHAAPHGPRDPGDLRAGEEHGDARPRPRVRGDGRGRGDLRRGERHRLLGVPGLPARVPAGLREGGARRDEGGRLRAPAPDPGAAPAALQGADREARDPPRGPLPDHPVVLRPGGRTGVRALRRLRPAPEGICGGGGPRSNSVRRPQPGVTMPQIKKTYPGKSAGEIYTKVDEVMERLAEKLALDYQKDGKARTGKVSKLGISGSYLVAEGEVTVDLKFPMLIPGSMRQKVQDDIERKLDGLFP